MYLSKFPFRMFSFCLLFLLSAPIAAQDEDQLGLIGTRDQSNHTSEPYQLVAACHEYCREITEIQDSGNE